MSDYRFNEPPPRPEFGPLPEGDYSFVVAESDEPTKNAKGNLVMRLRLSIQPSGTPVFANPWAGVDKNGQKRDQIAEFLICVNRAPKPGQEPNWNLVGAKGKCRLTTEVAQLGALAGKEVNKVHYFYTPKAAGKPQEEKQTIFSQSEFQKARQQQRTSAGEPEPSEIPY
jgi:hypothetical protein